MYSNKNNLDSEGEEYSTKAKKIEYTKPCAPMVSYWIRNVKVVGK